MKTVTKINLSNLKKCNQVWTDMPKNEKGRLCLKCNNTIIDFRNFTDSEIAETHLFSDQKVCGLYTKEQLKKPKKEKPSIKLKSWNSFYFGVFSFISLNSFSQENIVPVKTEQTQKTIDSFNKKTQKEKAQKHSVAKDSIFITGTLRDENNNPVIGGTVFIREARIGTYSDFDGFYKLNITKELDSLKKLTLSYNYFGYKRIEKSINAEFLKAKKNRSINIIFEEESYDFVEFVVSERAPFHKRVWRKIKNIFKKKK